MGRYAIRTCTVGEVTHHQIERMVAFLVAGVGMGTPPIKGAPARGSPVTRCKARASTVFAPPRDVVCVCHMKSAWWPL